VAVFGLAATISCAGGRGFGGGLFCRAAVRGGAHVDEPRQSDADDVEAEEDPWRICRGFP
jgi:hypothetical protein